MLDFNDMNYYLLKVHFHYFCFFVCEIFCIVLRVATVSASGPVITILEGNKAMQRCGNIDVCRTIGAKLKIGILRDIRALVKAIATIGSDNNTRFILRAINRFPKIGEYSDKHHRFRGR